jgi:hypothetical protein
MSTVQHRYGPAATGIYKPTHAKHPCTLWAGETRDNYVWLWWLTYELCGEYTRRYQKVHKVQRDGLLGRLISGQRPMRGIMDPLQSLDGSLSGFGLWPHAAAPVGSFGVTSIRPNQTLQPIARSTR